MEVASEVSRSPMVLKAVGGVAEDSGRSVAAARMGTVALDRGGMNVEGRQGGRRERERVERARVKVRTGQ